jgi:BirA family biotin operon repressor/biotin-[acetyl-CoA-carboxylase] ligase
LLELSEAIAPSATVLVTERQTAGRGRRGRVWHSSPGDSLTFSVLWHFPASSPVLPALSLAVGLAVARAMDGIGIKNVRLKWPNDVLYDGRKLAGILIERSSSNPHAVVIGIGLNLRMPEGLPDELRDVTTAIERFVEILPCREHVLAAILRSLTVILDNCAELGFASVREEWEGRHAFQGKAIRILTDHAPDRKYLCVGVGADGALIVDGPAGVQRLISGEISLRPE